MKMASNNITHKSLKKKVYIEIKLNGIQNQLINFFLNEIYIRNL